MKCKSSICEILDIFLENSLKTTGVSHGFVLNKSKSEVLVEIHPSPSFVICICFTSLKELLGELSWLMK